MHIILLLTQFSQFITRTKMIDGNHHQCLRALATITALTHFPALKRHFKAALPKLPVDNLDRPSLSARTSLDLLLILIPADIDMQLHQRLSSVPLCRSYWSGNLKAHFDSPHVRIELVASHTHTHQICAECVKHPADTFTDLRYILPKQTSEQINFDCFRLQCSAQFGLARLGSAPFGVGQATLGVASRRVSFLFFGDHGRCLLLL